MFIILMLNVIGSLLFACDVNSTDHASNDSKDIKKLIRLLDNRDAEKVRQAIKSIGELNTNESRDILMDLGFSGKLMSGFRNKEIYTLPKVKSELALQLVKNNLANNEIKNVLLNLSHSKNHIVKLNVIEGAKYIKGKKAINVIFTLIDFHDKITMATVIDALTYKAASKDKQYLDDKINSFLINNNIDREYIAALQNIQDLIRKGYIRNEKPRSEVDIYELAESFANKQQYKKARSLIMPLAKKNIPKAQLQLGMYYYEDNPPIYKEAAIWFQKAVDQKYVPAFYWLAQMYIAGEGVKINKVYAKELLIYGKEHGDPNASRYLKMAIENKWLE